MVSRLQKSEAVVADVKTFVVVTVGDETLDGSRCLGIRLNLNETYLTAARCVRHIDSRCNIGGSALLSTHGMNSKNKPKQLRQSGLVGFSILSMEVKYVTILIVKRREIG